jgi:hypothetical protein
MNSKVESTNVAKGRAAGEWNLGHVVRTPSDENKCEKGDEMR